MFVRYSGNLIVHLWQGGRGRVSGSEIISALIFSYISVGTGSVFSRCRPEGMWCDAALRIMAGFTQVREKSVNILFPQGQGKVREF